MRMMLFGKPFGLILRGVVPRYQSVISSKRGIAWSFQLAHRNGLFNSKYQSRLNSTATRTLGEGASSGSPESRSTETSDYVGFDGTSRIRKVRGEIPVEVKDGVVIVGDMKFPNIWLRDNCQCSSCVHPHTKQRLLDTFQIPRNIAIQASDVGVAETNIQWSDGHKSSYDHSLLRAASDDISVRAERRQADAIPYLWGAEIKETLPTLSYKAMKTRKVQDKHHEGTKALLKLIRKYGFCFIYDVPFKDGNATKAVLENIAFLRETHYGGFYDFTADLASKDTAYTNIALEAHTDTTYFSDPAGLQAFHLLSHTDGEGGASLLVDGFKVAEDLKELDPEAYEILATVNIYAHASGNAGISIQPYKGFPVLQHDPITGRLMQVRWNTSDRAGIELPVSDVTRWYDAARKFDALLKKKENEYWEQLKPGNLLIFDNWRVLHGRSAFTGKRRICGGYVNRDDWISRYKMLKQGSQEVLGSIAAS